MFAEFREDLISFNQVAQQLRVHLSTIHRWCGTGVRGKKLPTCLLGGRRYVRASDLAAFLDVSQPSDAVDHVRQRRAQNLLQSFGVRSSRDGSHEA